MTEADALRLVAYAKHRDQTVSDVIRGLVGNLLAAIDAAPNAGLSDGH